MDTIPRETVVYDILGVTDLLPSQLYDLRMVSTSMYVRYRDSLRQWVIHPESWMTAVVNDDHLLYRDLQLLMSRGDVLISEYYDYDSDGGTIDRVDQYLRTYRDLNDIELTVGDLLSSMYKNNSHSVFREAMTNSSFRRSLFQLYHRDRGIVVVLVTLANGDRETLSYLISMFRHDGEVIDSIIRLMVGMFGDIGAEDILSLVKEEGVRIDDQMASDLYDDVNDDVFHRIDPEYVSHLIENYMGVL